MLATYVCIGIGIIVIPIPCFLFFISVIAKWMFCRAVTATVMLISPITDCHSIILWSQIHSSQNLNTQSLSKTACTILSWWNSQQPKMLMSYYYLHASVIINSWYHTHIQLQTVIIFFSYLHIVLQTRPKLYYWMVDCEVTNCHIAIISS